MKRANFWNNLTTLFSATLRETWKKLSPCRFSTRTQFLIWRRDVPQHTLHLVFMPQDWHVRETKTKRCACFWLTCFPETLRARLSKRNGVVLKASLCVSDIGRFSRTLFPISSRSRAPFNKRIRNVGQCRRSSRILNPTSGNQIWSIRLFSNQGDRRALV